MSLMIGANDLLICQETTADHCASLIEQAGVLGTLTANVKTILSAIRNKAHYTGQIVIVNYYSLNCADQSDSTDPYSLNHDRRGGGQAVPRRDRGRFDEFAAAAAHSGGNRCTAGLLTQLSDGRPVESTRATPVRPSWPRRSRRRFAIG